MNKEQILKTFSDEDKHLISKIIDDIELCFDIEYIVYSNCFYPPSIWMKLTELSDYIGIKILTFGLNEEAEKKLLGFYPKKIDLDLSSSNPDIIFFEIDGRNKFNTLYHKDFLGALMSLSIKRELIGDLVVKENICYGVTTADIFKIIKESLDSIGKVPVEIYEVSNEVIPKTEFKFITITVSSSRIDAVIAELGNISRNEAVSKIESGEALLNYRICKDKSFSLKKGDVITIRKKGKFIFQDELGENKKGKLKLNFKQLI